mmetsp:Transcript_41788/g.75554  ORF Transcript_41788/g.75554 Transcript_41788/m.75554 type:complete len:156 (-) Transcript_41788:304-771(-)
MPRKSVAVTPHLPPAATPSLEGESPVSLLPDLTWPCLAMDADMREHQRDFRFHRPSAARGNPVVQGTTKLVRLSLLLSGMLRLLLLLWKLLWLLLVFFVMLCSMLRLSLLLLLFALRLLWMTRSRLWNNTSQHQKQGKVRQNPAAVGAVAMCPSV